MPDTCVYMWEFMVDDVQRIEFEHHYGPSGTWAALFGRARGYLGTKLLRDEATAGRYLTIDRWESKTAYRSFRSEFATEYSALDLQCEALTREERALGCFAEIAS